jgi:ribosomal protein S18 acetylase RimI-like enzyme
VLPPRAPLPRDWPLARAVLAAEAARHPYAERTLELLDAAETSGTESEYHAAVAGVDGAAAGVVVYGMTAGASGAGALYGIAVAAAWRRRGVGSALVRHAAGDLRTLGARFVLAEVPEDPLALGDVLALLAAAGFRAEARVADFYRDGVGMVFMRRELGEGDGGSP